MTDESGDIRRIERDLEHTRARLDSTLDALQQKLSPGQMVDEAMNWFKDGSGAEFGRNLGRSVRENPIPVALIGVGLGWLMLGSGQRREDRYGYGETRGRYSGASDTDYRTGAYAQGTVGAYPDQPAAYQAAAYDDLATKAHEAGARVERGPDESEDTYRERVYAAKASVVGVTRQVGETISAFAERVEAAIEAAAERVRRMGERMTSRAGEAADQGKAGLRSLYGYGQSAAYGARDNAGYAAWRARDMGSRTADYLKEQPLLMGILGVAVGAVLGMLVPPTRYEREVAEDLRRRLADQARGAAGELTERAKRVAEAVLDTAHESARREGLTGMSPSGVAAGAREQVADAAGRVRTVVEESVHAGREALQGETKDAAGSASTDATATSRSDQHGDRRPVA